MKCEFSLLRTLVQQSKEPGVEVDAIAIHIESCEACRCQLEDLGGGREWWNEAGRWLGMHTGNSSDVELDGLNQDAIDLSFLDPPHHPEMLGRIGQYEVESLLGHGGMGVVFRAHDSDLQRAVAVKVLAPQWAASPLARQRFAREAEAAASVAHENVVPIYNVNATAKLPYLVMRYIPGMTLQRWVVTHGPLDVGTILRVAGQIVEGLAAAHRRGLVHRDIKPGNILVGENIQRVWITDFGLARAADSMLLTRTGVIAGTPHYMSPEQARGQSMDHRSDLFSLGCVLYFLCMGKPPYEAENTLAVLHRIVSENAMPLDQQRADLPPSFVRLVTDLLQRSVERRPQDCQMVLNQLSVAQKEFHNGQTKRPRSRWRFVAASTVVICLMLVSIGILRWKTMTHQAPRGNLVRSQNIDRELDVAIARIADVSREQQLKETLDWLNGQLTRTAMTSSDFGNDFFGFESQNWDSSVAQFNTEIERSRVSGLPALTVFDANEARWQNRLREIESEIRQANTTNR